MGPVHVGVDVGQVADPTAVIVAEVSHRQRSDGKGTESVFTIRDLTRLPLGTSYVVVCEYLVALLDKLNGRISEEHGPVAAQQRAPGDGSESPPPPPWLVIDATGVGQPVADELRKGLAGQRVMLTEAIFTGGERLEVDTRARRISVPKIAMVSNLQVLLEWRRAKLPETPMARALAAELRDFEVRSVGTNDVFGAFRTGVHDDLVVALGLACLEGPRSAYEDRGLVSV